MITASASVGIFENATVILQRENGEDVEGIWVSSLETFEEQDATVQNAKTKDITWLDSGGERLKATKKVFFDDEPLEVPDFVSINNISYKVRAWDFRPSRDYYKIVIEEQFNVI